MLYSISHQRYITETPHRRFYETCCARLSEAQFRKIFAELNGRIDSSEIHTSSWIPGAKWRGTLYYPILRDACRYDEDAAAKFFGLILWDVMLKRPEAWAFGRYEKNNIPIEGLTYFQIEPQLQSRQSPRRSKKKK